MPHAESPMQDLDLMTPSFSSQANCPKQLFFPIFPEFKRHAKVSMSSSEPQDLKPIIPALLTQDVSPEHAFLPMTDPLSKQEPSPEHAFFWMSLPFWRQDVSPLHAPYWMTPVFPTQAPSPMHAPGATVPPPLAETAAGHMPTIVAMATTPNSVSIFRFTFMSHSSLPTFVPQADTFVGTGVSLTLDGFVTCTLENKRELINTETETVLAIR